MEALRTAAAIGMSVAAIGGGEAIIAAPASAHEGQGANAVAHEASSQWTHLGSDPLVPGGIHSGHDFVRLVTSSKGHAAMQLEGLNKKEIAAVDSAARHGEETQCTLRYGQTFDAMVFGINGASIDRNVTFLDSNYKNGAPAWCLKAVLKHGKSKETINMMAPDKCANLTLVNRRSTTTHPVKHPHTAPVSVQKIAEDDQGHQLPATPTGTFDFEINCKSGRDTLDRKVVYNRTPQFLAKCSVGKVATVKELPTLGNEPWQLLSKNPQQVIVQKKGNKLVFKDREIAPNTPPAATMNCSGNTTNTGSNSGVGGEAQGGNCSTNINCSVINSNNSEACTTTPPKQPGEHGCTVSTVTEKDGRTVNLTVNTDANPSKETVDWGDSQTSSYASTASTQEEQHFYTSDGTFNDTVTLTFADGGSAACTGQSVTRQESAPPAPAP
jgi:hypothetical protein